MAKHKVTINAGHGGHDSGAVRGKIYEKVLNLAVALDVKKYLVDKGVEIIMTRVNDSYLSLSGIVKIANDSNSDLLVSIHHNAGGGDGYEIYHSKYGGIGLELANKLSTQYKSLGQNAHGKPVKTRLSRDGSDYYTVISDSKMPCIISEFGFMDTIDYRAFDTQIELHHEAIAIGKAICLQLGISIAEPVKINYVLPLQKFLNGLGMTDASNRKLVEDGFMGKNTQSALDKLIKKL